MSQRKRRSGRPAGQRPGTPGQQPQHENQDRPLRTVTAVLMTPEEFPGELGESFQAAWPRWAPSPRHAATA